jgi:hypothetical protein
LKEKERRESLWQVDPLLGNDRETNKKTIAVSRQRPVNSNRVMVFSARFALMTAHETMETATKERCFLCDPCLYVISRTISESAVQCRKVKNWLVSQATAVQSLSAAAVRSW